MWHTCQSPDTPVNHLTHLSIIWHTCQSFGTPANHVAHLSIMRHNCQSFGTPVNHLAHLPIMWHTCQSCDTTVNHLALCTEIIAETCLLIGIIDRSEYTCCEQATYEASHQAGCIPGQHTCQSCDTPVNHLAHLSIIWYTCQSCE